MFFVLLKPPSEIQPIWRETQRKNLPQLVGTAEGMGRGACCMAVRTQAQRVRGELGHKETALTTVINALIF